MKSQEQQRQNFNYSLLTADLDDLNEEKEQAYNIITTTTTTTTPTAVSSSELNNNNNNKSLPPKEDPIYLYKCNICQKIVPVQEKQLMLELLWHMRRAHYIRMRPDNIGIKKYFEEIIEEEEEK